MSAPQTPRRRGLGWFNGIERADTAAPTPDSATVIGEARGLEQRRLFDEVGEFLFANGLDPSPRNFMVVHAYLSGEDVAIAAAITQCLRHGEALDEAAITRIVEGRQTSEITPAMLAQLAGALEQQLEECLGAVDRSRDSQASFGSALDDEARNLAADPAATLQRMIALTRDAVDATRLIEAQLQRTRMQTDHLRIDLRSAQHAADHDHLTGLMNRRAFEARLTTVPATETPACVALCDIDDFKQINDRFGHDTGDRVLKYVATFLSTHSDPNVTVARYGGEEFAFLLERHDLAQAVAALDRVRERLAARSLVNERTGEPIGAVTFSGGVAPLPGEDRALALRQADVALYAAKRSGKNVVQAAEQDPASATTPAQAAISSG